MGLKKRFTAMLAATLFCLSVVAYGEGISPSATEQGSPSVTRFSTPVKLTRKIPFDSGAALIAALMLFSAIGAVASVRGIVSVAAESATAKDGARVLAAGDRMPFEKKKRVLGVRLQRFGFRFKIFTFTIALVLLSVMVASIPLYCIMTSTRREPLSEELLLQRTILIVTLSAIVIGIAVALVFSAVIIGPVKKLVRHIETIRDFADKPSLAGMNLQITGSDEIAVLGKTINEMARRLAKAALAASDLSIGREIQKRFLPLELDSVGNKRSSGFKDTKNARFFGYYEGAKGISGDYFDYQDLDGRYYAIIKCDVAGKGIPAALIMVQVATMFLNYCKNWHLTARGMHIEEAVYQINDFIEMLGFQGRFAALNLCLFDSETGAIQFCNAGDSLVHIFDASEQRLKTITLPSCPVAGVFSNALVESKGGYRTQTLFLKHGDMLVLYTDGIEEAKRKFRDSSFNETVCANGPYGTAHENHMVGQNVEEMGTERVCDIINAVMNQEFYTLHKWHSPGWNQDLQFDFSNCSGSVDEVIMALVSVEKMFRCYQDSRAGAESVVLVDKKIDAFLKAHFLQYCRYCSCTRSPPDNDAYIYYTHVEEDELYDDLCILGVMLK